MDMHDNELYDYFDIHFPDVFLYSNSATHSNGYKLFKQYC